MHKIALFGSLSAPNPCYTVLDVKTTYMLTKEMGTFIIKQLQVKPYTNVLSENIGGQGWERTGKHHNQDAPLI